jgi:hypothetical protein
MLIDSGMRPVRALNGSPVTPPDSSGAWRPGGRRRVVVIVIGLAAVARLARDSRSYEPAVVAVIALGAMAALGRASRERSFARLAAWDKRRSTQVRR